MQVTIGLIGEYRADSPAHHSIPPLLMALGEEYGVRCNVEWINTDTITKEALGRFDGLWCVPGSPYRSFEGALLGIRFAREMKIPFLGTCGGFQHATLEFARNVAGIHDASHEELHGEGGQIVIVPLSCSLYDTEAPIELDPSSKLFSLWGEEKSIEEYRCRYGISSHYLNHLLNAGLTISARGIEGEVRAVELQDHPFYMAMLF